MDLHLNSLVYNSIWCSLSIASLICSMVLYVFFFIKNQQWFRSGLLLSSLEKEHCLSFGQHWIPFTLEWFAPRWLACWNKQIFVFIFVRLNFCYFAKRGRKAWFFTWITFTFFTWIKFTQSNFVPNINLIVVGQLVLETKCFKGCKCFSFSPQKDSGFHLQKTLKLLVLDLAKRMKGVKILMTTTTNTNNGQMSYT